jgi:hypothetical protein
MSEIIVAPNGMLRFIYDDDLASMLQDIGTLSIKRASHVEPDPEHGGWTADMSPVGGGVLGPYLTRSIALEEEKAWLNKHGIPIPKDSTTD